MLASAEKTFEPSKALLVVVDMQNGFLNEFSLPVISSVRRLLAECYRRNLPVIFTEFVNPPSSVFDRMLEWTEMRERPEVDIHESLREFVHTSIVKNYYTAFTDEFENFIRRKKCETLLISGVSTESCILKTALDAFERGIRPVVVSDACASDIGPDKHSEALELMKITIGAKQIMTIDELMREFGSVKEPRAE